MLSPDSFPYKPTHAPEAPFTLPDWSVLELAGPDACAFLHAQVMSDVRALADARWQWSGWLTPKGRVRALFALLRVAPERFLLVLPDQPAAALAAALRGFVFRSKVTLHADAGWRVAGDGRLDAGAAPTVARARAAGGFTLDAGSVAFPRALHLVSPDDTSAIPDDPAADAAWRAVDLRFGLPRLDAGQRDAFTPQMLSLERLRAFSLAKGCYPGQEIVSRTHYLGQAKRELVLLAGGPFAAGDEVRDAAGLVVGNLASIAADGRLGLAVLARERAAGDFRAGAGGARELALEDGLRRPV
jgi:folate-binding protein YgfZ